MKFKHMRNYYENLFSQVLASTIARLGKSEKEKTGSFCLSPRLSLSNYARTASLGVKDSR